MPLRVLLILLATLTLPGCSRHSPETGRAAPLPPECGTDVRAYVASVVRNGEPLASVEHCMGPAEQTETVRFDSASTADDLAFLLREGGFGERPPLASLLGTVPEGAPLARRVWHRTWPSPRTGETLRYALEIYAYDGTIVRTGLSGIGPPPQELPNQVLTY